ncbi:MAG: vitamin K epoxide reductase family protein [Wenzhouxiangellaceae bacterium]|nr:vitamin K epoxide reductase family protein [Wenzhouxiangellaceae bacterium]
MSKRKSGHARSRGPATPQKPAHHKLQPDWPLTILAGIGMLITGYLAVTAFGSSAPLFCGPESGCDVVQNSRYSTLLGLPVSLWGFGLYALIAWSAATLPARLKRWQRLVWLASIGLAVSLYLTLTGLIVLDAWCVWCMTSQVVMLALFVAVFLRRPSSAPGMPWMIFNRNLALGGLFVAGVLFAWQNDLLRPPENPELKALAIHLEQSGARYFGAFWCPNCQDQREMFGRSADRLPYVECSPNGRGGMVAFECVANDISGYPTWIIDGRRFQQVLTPEELALHSDFEFDSADEQNQSEGQP